MGLTMGPLARLAYRLFGQEIKKALAENELRPKGLADLQHAFTGTDGRAYYTWANVGDLPRVRSRKIGELLTWADAGMSRKTMEELADAITLQHKAALVAKGPEAVAKELAKATALVQELLTRGRDIIPEDIYHEIAAVLAVREDEDPATLDKVIQAQKAEMLRTAGRAGVPLAIQLPSLGSIAGLSLTTAESYAALLIDWTRSEATRRAKVEAITSAKG